MDDLNDGGSFHERRDTNSQNCMASESDQHGSTIAWSLVRVSGMGVMHLLSSPQMTVVYGIDFGMVQ